MGGKAWQVTFRVWRQKGLGKPHFDAFRLEIDPDEYVLDGIERIWAFQDRSLTFRHVCHHSTCGACGMRVNGVEKLTCITPVREVTQDGGTLTVEPLRNFPVLSDLVVDLGSFYTLMDEIGYPAVAPVAETPAAAIPPRQGIRAQGEKENALGAERLNDCIECGLCVSACPIAATTPTYLGPAVLAGIQACGLDASPDLAALADQAEGLWRCHSAYECTAVCPSFVDPAGRIMDLRRQLIHQRIQGLFKTRG